MKKTFLAFLLCASAPLIAKQYSGQTLRVLTFKDNHSRAVFKNIKKFEEKTGAKVVFDMVPAASVASKTASDQVAGASYDLYSVDEPFMPKLAPFFVPTEQWPKTKLFVHEFKDATFIKAAVKGGSYKSKSYGLPINGNVYMYVYRKDLFSDPTEKQNFQKKFGYPLGVPKTTKQMLDVAEFFTRPPKLYGFAPYTKVSEGSTVEAVWLLSSFGVKLYDDNLNVAYAEKQGAKAFKFYKQLMKSSPPGSGNWAHAERVKAYAKGKIAQIMLWPSFFTGLEDTRRSLVAGKNGYQLPPSLNGKHPSPVAGTWTLAISKKSQRKDLAAEFAWWWSSNGRVLVQAGMNPVREDLLTDPILLKSNHWFPSILDNLKVAVVRPRLPEYKRVSDIISLHFTQMATDQVTPEEASKTVATELKQLMKDLKG